MVENSVADTYIMLFGLRILEPMTALTDIFVAVVCFYCYFKTNTSNDLHNMLLFFKNFFLFMGISTAYGGIIGHALQHYVVFEWKMVGWIVSMISIMFLERAAIMHAKPLLWPMAGKIYAIANIIEIVSMTIVVLITRKFLYVEAHAAYGLLIVVLSMELFIYIKTKAKVSLYILIAIFSAVLSVIAHLGKIAPHKWFNHLDVSHMFMALSMWLVYLGVKELK